LAGFGVPGVRGGMRYSLPGKGEESHEKRNCQ
jgi:hypothetical protein